MKKEATKDKQFPDKIYCGSTTDEIDGGFIFSSALLPFRDGEKVAVYELVDVRRVVKKTKLV